MAIPRIVIDTNVIVSAMNSSRGASSRLVAQCGEGLFEHILSVPLTFEYEAVCRYCIEDPFEAELFLDYLVESSIRMPFTRSVRPFSPDPKDDMVLEAAVSGHARHIITFNNRHFIGTERYGISILPPGDFLTAIGL